MKICLIKPPQITPLEWGRQAPLQPLGLAYLAAVLEKDHEVSILDAQAEAWDQVKKIGDKYYFGLPPEEIEKKIKDLNPELVGISVQFSIDEESSLAVAKLVKSINKKIITVLGGPHCSVRPLDVLSNPDVDFVVLREGEETFFELARELAGGNYGSLEKVLGIAYKKDGQPFFTPPRPFIQNLDLLPLPARHLLPMEKYFQAAESGQVPRDIYTFSPRWASVITSRSCPYNCAFCSVHLSMGRGFRPRSPENVVEEIEQLVRDYRIEHINFEDDNMTLDKKRFKDICDLMVARNIKITWSTPNGIRADAIDEELVQKMKKSGCKRVVVSPESGVQRVVSQIIKKNLDLKKIEEAVALFKKHGIEVDASFVVGMIGETKKDIWATIRYGLKLKRLGMSKAGFNIATPLYGTELYELAKQKNYLKKDMSSSLLSPSSCLIDTPEWTGQEVRAFCALGNWLVNYNLREKILKGFSGFHKYFKHIGKLLNL
ncbi:MAG: radical SAM protein [bacterium]